MFKHLFIAALLSAAGFLAGCDPEALPETAKVVLLDGDSHMYGAAGTISLLLATDPSQNYISINQAVGGQRVTDTEYNPFFNKKRRVIASSIKLDIVVVSLGTNDQKVADIPTFERDIQAYIDQFPGIPIIWLLPHSGCTVCTGKPSLLKVLGNNSSQVTILDAEKWFLDNNILFSKYISEDGIHLTPEGYRDVGNLLYNTITDTL